MPGWGNIGRARGGLLLRAGQKPHQSCPKTPGRLVADGVALTHEAPSAFRPRSCWRSTGHAEARWLEVDVLTMVQSCHHVTQDSQAPRKACRTVHHGCQMTELSMKLFWKSLQIL